MMNTLLIFLGAGIGGVLRYWIFNSASRLFGQQFPFGTLIVNVSGCFLMGLLYVVILERMNGTGQPLRMLMLIGLLGGYTTFSAFSIETLSLIEHGDWLAATLNMLLSVALCLLVTWLGIVLGRQL